MNALFAQCGCGRTNVAGELVDKVRAAVSNSLLPARLVTSQYCACLCCERCQIMRDPDRDWSETDTLINALVLVINDDCDECVASRVVTARLHAVSTPVD